MSYNTIIDYSLRMRIEKRKISHEKVVRDARMRYDMWDIMLMFVM